MTGSNVVDASYGITDRAVAKDELDLHVEAVRNRGYSVIENLLSQEELTVWRDRIDAVYATQEASFGRDRLVSIREQDLCRAPLLYDRSFIDLAMNSTITAVVSAFLGGFFILNLQNAIINRPNIQHHQSSWHRDLPYQNFVISRPLSINALLAIDPFSSETGGTQFLPFSHRIETLPTQDYIDNNRVIGSAPAGSVIIFDSMLFHRAGANSSPNIRRAINQMYTVPILKQQYDFPRALAAEQSGFNVATQQLLGFTAQVPLNDREWRETRAAKLSAKT